MLRGDRPSAAERRISRRGLIRRGAGTAAGSVLLATGAGTAAVPAPLQATPEPEPRLREFTLTAQEFDWQLMSDVTVRAWGYNGQMPGPELRVREGDTVRVTLVNQLPVPTTIHWHGVNVPNAMDGVAGLNQAPVDPGNEFVYEFVARPAGSRWYHSHTDPALQVPLGLYGPLVVEPRTPGPAYAREYVLVLAEWDQELTPAVAAGAASRGPGDRRLRGGELGSDFFLINGRMHGAVPPIRIATGERVLLRLLHAGAIPHPFHTHGHSFRIVATDGNPVPDVAQMTKDTVLIGPAERYDLEVTGDNPGVWMVHCHIEHHMANGMMTTIWYDGYQPTGPYADVMAADSPAMPSPERHDHDAETAVRTATENPAAAGNQAEIAMLDDRFDPTLVTVPTGTTVTWVNKGADWHSVAAFDGSFESSKIPPGGSFSVRLETAGTYKYLCKHHGMQGMIATIVVEDSP